MSVHDYLRDVFLPGALRMRAVYWGPVQGTDQYGQPSYPTPVEIRCRWRDGGQQFVNAAGSVQVPRATVLVDRDLELRGVLWLGRLAALTTEQKAAPFGNVRAFEIMQFHKEPDYNCTKFVRKALL